MLLRAPIILLVLTFASAVPLFSQSVQRVSDEAGIPFYLTHFPAHEYAAHPQNWSVTQDNAGVIYVANFDGVLLFDGVRWELVTTPSNTTVRSLDVGMNNTVFVGQQGDLGYLVADSLGRLQFNSLVAKIPEEHRDFWDVWATHATEKGAYFQTSTKLFYWDGERFQIWESGNGFHTSFEVNGEIYIREKDVGLLRLAGNQLELTPGGSLFSDKQIFLVESLASGGLLVATQKDGFFRYDGVEFERFETEADEYLQSHRLYTGALMAEGRIALGLLDGGGFLVLDANGRKLLHLREGYGLPDGWINYVFVDGQGGVWLALNNNGIIRLDPLSQITKFGHDSGLEGAINDFVRYKEKLYVGTSTGLFSLDPSNENSLAGFRRVPNIWVATSLEVASKELLVVGHGGVYTLRGESVNKVVDGTFFTLGYSIIEPGLYFLGSQSGISFLRRSGSHWTIEDDVVYVGEDVYGIVQDSGGDLWLTTRSGKVYRAPIAEDYQRKIEYTFENETINGLLVLRRIGGEIAILGSTGTYIPANSGGTSVLKYVPYAGETAYSNGSDTLLTVAADAAGDVWKLFQDRVEIHRKCPGICGDEVPEMLTFPNWKRPARIHIDSTGVAWISSGSTLVRYDPSVPTTKSYEAKFPALLRRVVAIDSNRLLFGGAINKATSENVIPDLPFQSNALRFEFALPSYNDVSRNEFQYWLEGKDNGWSDWTRETSKNYTNLLEGTYRFHIRGRNAQGYVSEESVYTFRVLPPWYRSTWAYGAYFLVLIGIGLFARRHHRMALENKRAKKQAIELAREREVNERLHDLNNRLHQANETLRQADRLKDEFLANTSHELRTPLTGILGCSAILRDEVPEDQREFVDMIDENGQRLLNTLDSLLDLARLRAGLMELDLKPIDVADRAKRIMHSYYPLASSKGVALQVATEGDVCGLYDDHCLDCILNHLIGNAVKFTDEGQVDVNLIERSDHLIIEVVDTGVGIDEEFMPYLFDEFKQESTGLTRSHEGNGLGMAVTSRIVTLMGGVIDVTSTKGVGTTFTVRLPLDREERAEDEEAHLLAEAHIDSTNEGLAA